MHGPQSRRTKDTKGDHDVNEEAFEERRRCQLTHQIAVAIILQYPTQGDTAAIDAFILDIHKHVIDRCAKATIMIHVIIIIIVIDGGGWW